MVRRRIPHPNVPTEVRQAFQRATEDTSILTDGASGEVLVGAGVGSTPAWGTELTSLTKLTVDNITINGAAITSDTGAISFGDENLTTTGTISGVNVTSGADPGHTHTGASLSGIDISDDTNLAVTAPIVLMDDTLSLDTIDISDDTNLAVTAPIILTDDTLSLDTIDISTHTNLAVTAPIVLTDDTLSLDQSGIDHGSIGGLTDDDHTQYLLADGSRDLTGDLSVDAGITIDGRDISADGLLLDEAYGWGDHGAEPYLWSSDTGTAWTDLGTMYSQTKIWCLEYVGSGVALAGTYTGGYVLRSTDYGATWSSLGQQASGETSVRSLCNLGGGIVVGGTGAGGHIIRSADSGATWSDLGQQHSCSWIYCIADCGSGIVIAGTSASGKILRSTDYGATWSDLGSPDGGTSTQVYSIIYLGSGIALAGTTSTGKVFRSTDYGVTWSDLGQQHSVAGVRCFVHLGSGVVLAGTGNGGKLIKSTDWGATWTDEGQVGSETKFGYFAYTGTVLVAGFNDSGRVHVSTDDGVTWTNLGQQGSAAGILSAAYLENDISVIGTRDNGKILRSTGYSTTSVTPANWDAAYEAIGKAAVDSSATADYLGAASNDGVLRTGTGLTYTDGGDYITLTTNDSEIDHGSLGGVGDDDHTIYLLADGTRNLTGNLTVDALVTIDGRDLSVDGTKLDGIEAGADVTDATNVAAAGAAMVGGAHHNGFSDYVAAEHLSLPNTIANVLTDHTLATHTALGCQGAITTNTTYYISTSGNDTTGDGSSGDPWATIDKAMSEISSSLIVGATVTIQLGDGTYTLTAGTASFDHAMGNNITITGENTYDISLTSIQSSAGAAGAWSVVLNVSDVSNAAVNDYLLVPYDVAGGTRPETLAGVWKITNVDAVNTRITVLTTHKHTSAPSGAVAGTVTIVKTILDYSGYDGMTVSQGFSIGTLNKMVLVGDSTASTMGLDITERAYAGLGSAFGVVGFDVGINVNPDGNLYGDYVKACGAATYNLRVYYGNARVPWAVFSGSPGNGIDATQGNVIAKACVCSGNTGYGMIFRLLSAVEAKTAATKVTYNTGTGIYASIGSIVQANSATVSNNGTNFSPAANTSGNVEAHIQN